MVVILQNSLPFSKLFCKILFFFQIVDWICYLFVWLLFKFHKFFYSVVCQVLRFFCPFVTYLTNFVFFIPKTIWQISRFVIGDNLNLVIFFHKNILRILLFPNLSFVELCDFSANSFVEFHYFPLRSFSEFHNFFPKIICWISLFFSSDELSRFAVFFHDRWTTF